MALKTPIAIIIFKRLDATKKMFETVRTARPQDLYVIADGWRNDAEKAKCLAVREFVENQIDWPCNLHKNYVNTNLGCKERVVSGLNWVFSETEEAIIVEDDCVPDQSFYHFSEELLRRYRDDSRIMQISGLNTQHKNLGFSTGEASYYFSDLGEIWGWATWRRAWKLYDIDIEKWPGAKTSGMLARHFKDPAVIDYWEHLFDEIYEARREPRKFDAWAAQWVFARFLHDGLSAVPKTNLILNFGDDEDAARAKDTHSLVEDDFRRPIVPLSFPLVHPEAIQINYQADAYTLRYGFKIKGKLSEKILFFLKISFPTLHKALKYLKKIKARFYLIFRREV